MLAAVSEANAASDGPSLRQALGLDRHPLTRGKLLALGAALAMMVFGTVLTLWSPAAARMEKPILPERGERVASEPAVPGIAGSGFAEPRPVPGPPAAETPEASPPEPAGPAQEQGWSPQDWSPFLLKGGFGLFLGFSIGFAVRAFLRLAVLVAGFYFLLLAIMAYAGWVEVRWDVMSGQFSDVAKMLVAQFSSLKAFLNGAIPASGLTAAGLALGLRGK